MNENDDDDGALGNYFPVAVAAGAGSGEGGEGGTTLPLPHDGAASAYAAASWNEFFGSNHNHANSITDNNNGNGGDASASGMMASSSTATTPFMNDLQLNDHPMVSFSDTGGMGMAAMAGGTKYDESNDYYEDSSPQQHQTTVNGNDMTMRPTSRNGDRPNSCSNSNSIRNSGEHHANDILNFHPDLPFLVTHWLSTFVPPPAPTNTASTTTPFTSSSPRLLAMTANNANTNNNAFEKQRQDAIQLIRHHASSLAHAFQTLGAFGLSSSSSSSSSNVGTIQGAATTWNCRPTTYADMTRKYSHLVNVALPSSTHEKIVGVGRMMDGTSCSRSGSSIGHCLDGNGNRLGALLGALVCASAQEQDSTSVQNGMRGTSSIMPAVELPPPLA